MYAAHRRAYVPRFWPLALGAGTTVFVVVALVHPSAAIAIAIGVVCGAVLPSLRLWIWRRRHPVITPEQYAADWREAMRRAARWN